MNTYIYSPLKDPQRDIRLLELQPAARDDDIRLRIYHATLETPPKQQRNQDPIDLEELKSTLPPDWKVHKTYEGRYLFCDQSRGNGKTVSHWTHPDPSFEYLSRHVPGDDTRQHELKFEALSYVWGSALDPEEIFVEATSEPSGYASLSVGQNLAKALRHLRHKANQRTLWIDAVCINQSDIPEREAQVLRMADVYSLASRVVVWLGPETETTGEAIDTLRYLGQQVEDSVDRWLSPSPEASEPMWYEESCDLPYTPETCEAIVELLRREWFQRVWVLQEVMLANSHATMQCGHHHITWALFRRAITCLADKHKLPSQDLWGRVSQVADMAGSEHTINPIAESLIAYLWRKATDPRDKVYGVLGLFSPEFRQKIKPQYGASVARVYTDLIVAHMEHTRRLEILQICGLGMPGIERPSWVLDFASRHPMARDLRYQLAAMNSACHASFIAPDKLKVSGVTVAHLAKIESKNRMPRLDSYLSNSSYENMLRAIREAQPAKLDEATYLAGETFREAYARALVVNQVRSRFPLYRIDTTNTWCLQKSANALFGDEAAKGLSDPNSLSVTERAALENLSGRTVAETEEGHVGLFPGDAQQGKLHELYTKLFTWLTKYFRRCCCGTSRLSLSNGSTITSGRLFEGCWRVLHARLMRRHRSSWFTPQTVDRSAAARSSRHV